MKFCLTGLGASRPAFRSAFGPVCKKVWPCLHFFRIILTGPDLAGAGKVVIFPSAIANLIHIKECFPVGANPVFALNARGERKVRPYEKPRFVEFV